MARRSGILTSLVVAALILGGCGLPLTMARPTPTPFVARSADPVAIAAKEALHPDPNFDFGQTVQITPQGVHPAVLISTCCQTVVWKNLTAAPLTVVFDHQPLNSGPVPPGGSWTWNPPNMQSLTYHIDGHPDLHGQVQVTQTFESMTRRQFTIS